jgi:serine protease DegQ
MKRIWLLFAQTVTVTLAVLFVVSLLRPSWLPWLNSKGRVSGLADVVTTTEAAAKPVALVPPVAGSASFREAAKKALPSVVNISSVKSTRNRETIQDQRVREFFGLPPG